MRESGPCHDRVLTQILFAEREACTIRPGSAGRFPRGEKVRFALSSARPDPSRTSEELPRRPLSPPAPWSAPASLLPVRYHLARCGPPPFPPRFPPVCSAWACL